MEVGKDARGCQETDKRTNGRDAAQGTLETDSVAAESCGAFVKTYRTYNASVNPDTNRDVQVTTVTSVHTLMHHCGAGG